MLDERYTQKLRSQSATFTRKTCATEARSTREAAGPNLRPGEQNPTDTYRPSLQKFPDFEKKSSLGNSNKTDNADTPEKAFTYPSNPMGSLYHLGMSQMLKDSNPSLANFHATISFLR